MWVTDYVLNGYYTLRFNTNPSPLSHSLAQKPEIEAGYWVGNFGAVSRCHNCRHKLSTIMQDKQQADSENLSAITWRDQTCPIQSPVVQMHLLKIRSKETSLDQKLTTLSRTLDRNVFCIWARSL